MTEQDVIRKINGLIVRFDKEFKQTGKFNAAENERICGMLDVLEMFTGKSYWYDETGVHEKKN